MLVAGGFGSGGELLTTTELYDPATGTWSATGEFAKGRFYHTATLLDDGRCLLQADYRRPRRPERGTLRSCDGHLDDNRPVKPRTSKPYRDLAVRRQGAGGRRINASGASISSVEIYDPASGTWSTITPLAGERDLHSATLLQNGMVLVAGGSALWPPLGRSSMIQRARPGRPQARSRLSLPSRGDVIAERCSLGHRRDGPAAFSTDAEIYDPRTGTWTATGSLNVGRHGHNSILLRTGKVLIVAGQMFPDSESTKNSALVSSSRMPMSFGR